MPLPARGIFLRLEAKADSSPACLSHYFSLQLSLHFRVHISARDSILGFVGTGSFRQIGSSSNLSELVALGLPACSEGSRSQGGCPRAQRPRHVQTGGQGTLSQESLQLGRPCSISAEAGALALKGHGGASLSWASVKTDTEFPTHPQPLSTWRQVAGGSSREPSSDTPRSTGAEGLWAMRVCAPTHRWACGFVRLRAPVTSWRSVFAMVQGCVFTGVCLCTCIAVFPWRRAWIC